jgi:pimeloyl-ACP methyl ester carboxylesterase
MPFVLRRIFFLVTTVAIVCGGRLAHADAALARLDTSAATLAFDIPRLNAIQIDGNDADWGDRGFRVDALASTDGFEVPASEYNARFRLAWDQRGLLVLLNVHNTSPAEMADPTELWRGDAVELCLAPALGSPSHFQVILGPGTDSTHDHIRTAISDYRKPADPHGAPPLPPIQITVERTKIAEGYVMEMLIPWSALAIVPQPGSTFALQVTIDAQRHDTDGGNDQLRLPWFPSLDSIRDTTKMYTLRLSDHPSPPVQLAASAEYSRFRRLRVDVVTAAELAGKTIHIISPDGATATAKIDDHPIPAITTLDLPLPPPDAETPPTTQPGPASPSAEHMAISVGSDWLALPVFQGLAEARQLAYKRERLSARNFVFYWNTFPAIDFERPSEVEDEIGDYHLNIAFYDSDFKQVKSATRPGRYGAVVEVVTSAGVVDRRYQTLYRTPANLDWRGAFAAATAQFPADVGVDDIVVSEQERAVSDVLRQSLNLSLSRDESFAVLLSYLSEIQPGDVGVRHQNVWRRNDAWWTALKKSIGQFEQYQTVVHLPPGYDPNGSKHWPLILFLHGSDPHSDDPAVIKKQGLCEYAIEHPDFPFVVISPTSPPGQRFSAATLSMLLDDVMKQYDVDPDRVYLTGLSLGGYATWDLAALTPDRFAAAVPIAGYGDVNDAQRLKNLPMWVFHGEADPTVPIQPDRECVQAIRAIGGRVVFTTYPGVGHNSWTQTYANPKLYEWLLEQRRGAPAQPPATRPTTTLTAATLAP